MCAQACKVNSQVGTTVYNNYIYKAFSGVARGAKGAIAPPFFKESALEVEQSLTS